MDGWRNLLLCVGLCCGFLWAVSCGGNEKACETDAECGTSEICFAQKCAAGCRSSATCQNGQYCINNACITGVCAPGTFRECYEGDAATKGVGLCRVGKQYCNEKGQYGECSGQLLPTKESCDKVDNDCDGAVDQGLDCQCTPGQQRECYSSKQEFIGKGTCKSGTQVCGTDNKWSPCFGQVLPLPEICDGADNDCNGKADDGLNCVCENGDERSCYPAALQTLNVGTCQAGRQVCQDNKWGECTGPKDEKGELLKDRGLIIPTSKKCDGKDNNCDGKVDTDCNTAACTKDADCNGGKCLTLFGVCASSTSAPLTCTSDTSCPQDQKCNSTKRCEKQPDTCTQDTDCRSDHTCNTTTKKCEAKSTPSGPGEGEKCSQGKPCDPKNTSLTCFAYGTTGLEACHLLCDPSDTKACSHIQGLTCIPLTSGGKGACVDIDCTTDRDCAFTGFVCQPNAQNQTRCYPPKD